MSIHYGPPLGYTYSDSQAITITVSVSPFRWDFTESDEKAWKEELQASFARSFKFLENVRAAGCDCGGPPGHVPNGLLCRRPL